ncbi:MAG TPA: GNAT family N-acetyltransferase [Streptosporangiaceae bacterium]|nr:GNAT family N-acetyltransferase [Streptosporangiaceae bacterium]
MTPAQTTVQTHTPAAALDLAPTVCRLYRDVFSLPPFLGDEDEFQNQHSYYHDMLQRPGFLLTTAQDGNQPIGFSYGYLLPQDTTWWRNLSAKLPAEFTHETGQRTFALIDFGVIPGHRGKGIGRAIEQATLKQTHAERATLTVQRKASDTQQIYLHWGWQNVGEKEGNLGGRPVVFDVYALTLTDPARSNQTDAPAETDQRR